MIYKDDKRLIVPFITIWSLIVSFAILSVNREIDKLSESKNQSYQEVLIYDKQQTAFNEAEEIIIPHRKVKYLKKVSLMVHALVSIPHRKGKFNNFLQWRLHYVFQFLIGNVNNNI